MPTHVFLTVLVAGKPGPGPAGMVPTSAPWLAEAAFCGPFPGGEGATVSPLLTEY